jgi:hypothetical protein
VDEQMNKLGHGGIGFYVLRWPDFIKLQFFVAKKLLRFRQFLTLVAYFTNRPKRIWRANQGCQMIYFHTENAKFGMISKGL